MYKSEVYSTKDKNMYAKVVVDSIANGIRITTLELNYWRAIHSEFMTHRMFSRNASSSRAIPVEKMIGQVKTNPAMPIHWGKNQIGMQAYEELDWIKGKANWECAAENAAMLAGDLNRAGYHKQIVNRLLEPFQYIRVVVTATEFDNFFALRDHHAAQPEIQELAKLMKQAMDESEPTELQYGEWHLPYIDLTDDVFDTIALNYGWDVAVEIAIKCSAARCARVSYMNHDNSNPDIDKDLELYNMLATRPFKNNKIEFSKDEPVHLSPLEHQATPMSCIKTDQVILLDQGCTHVDRKGTIWSSNFRGWIQHRNLI